MASWDIKNMTTLELKDTKGVPDPFYPYLKNMKNGSVPLVIDNGSYQCRVGWAASKEPLLVFKNLVSRTRKERAKKDFEIHVGNDVPNLEVTRPVLKTPFDRNVVTHYEIQEQVFDYVFTHLGLDSKLISHPVVVTEPYVNPNYSRQMMSELLFESYGVPGVCYGVDGLFSFQYNYPKCRSALIVNCGHHTTHILPVLNGRVDTIRARRLNVGGYHVSSYLRRLLQLKYPAHYTAITPSRAEELVQDQCFLAENFEVELNFWSDGDYYDDNVVRVQLPYVASMASPSSSIEQQKERRRELARRLVELNARKREEKLAEDEEQLNQLLAVQDLLEEGDDEEYEDALESYGLSNLYELQQLIRKIQLRIEKTRQRIVAVNTSEEPVTEDSKSKCKIPKPKDEEDFEAWLRDIRQKRHDLIEKRTARRQRRHDMARRRTAAAQERMRIINQLARKDKRDDTFGMKDEDWDVYKVINKEGCDTDSDEDQRLLELEDILRHHDPDFEDTSSLSQGSTAENHQLHVGIERLRVPEILFQPSMIGCQERGLTQTIEYMLQQFSPQTQANLVSNVFLTGSCAQLPGFETRLRRELQEIRPFKSSYKVTVAENPSLDAWYGARNFAASSSINKYMITRKCFEECGGDYLKEHSCSNVYFACPSPIPFNDDAAMYVEEDEIGVFDTV